MSHHHQAQKTSALNPTIVTFIFVINFAIIGSLILANITSASSKPSGGESVALAPTDTAVQSPTSLPPTPTQPPAPAATSTPQAVAEGGQTNVGNTAGSYESAVVSQGQQLFMTCSACHGADARGLPNLGKDLVESEFVHSLSDDELLTFIKTGRPIWDPLNTTGLDMPSKGGNPTLTDEQILAIIAYLRTLAPSTTGIAAESTSTPQTVADAGHTDVGNTTGNYDSAVVSQGQQLFMTCSACHGADARGLPNLGKDLVESEFIHSLNDDELLTFIKTGRPIWDPLNTTGIDMPGKGGNPTLTDEQILAIIAYLRFLPANGG
jgi:disulfide bond formation protein DsbB